MTIKIVGLIISLIIIVDELVATFAQELGLCAVDDNMQYCYSNILLNNEYIAMMVIGLLIVLIFTFFILDKIFKKWLKFTFWYFLISIIWIAISPESSGSFIEILATKEQVSTFASVMFVIISLIMFIWLTIKEKKKK